MSIPKHIVDRALAYLEAGEDTMGLCIECGAENDCCEPDARNYTCESCGENKVFGCEEIIIMSPL